MPTIAYKDQVLNVLEKPPIFSMPGPAVNNLKTAKEVIDKSTLNWTVDKKPITLLDSDSPIKGTYALVPSIDNTRVLGIVKKHYSVLQNTDAFKFFDFMVDSGLATYEKAGATADLKRVWILAKLNKTIQVQDESIMPYVLLVNSHNGKHAIKVYITPVRAVCLNMLQYVAVRSESVSVVHNKFLLQKLGSPEKFASYLDNEFSAVQTIFSKMIQVKPTKPDEMKNMLLESVFPYDVGVDRNNDELNAVDKHRLWSKYFMDHGKGNTSPAVQNTVWAMYNGIAEYIDYREIQIRHDKTTNIMLGTGAELKRRAFEACVKLTEVAY